MKEGSSYETASELSFGPFGELVSETGSYVSENTYKFSTKPQDEETGYYYYGFRYYDSSNGRWLNRDPIRENGGFNLYGFIVNTPINSVDDKGLIRVCGSWTPDSTGSIKTGPLVTAQKQINAWRLVYAGATGDTSAVIHYRSDYNKFTYQKIEKIKKQKRLCTECDEKEYECKCQKIEKYVKISDLGNFTKNHFEKANVGNFVKNKPPIPSFGLYNKNANIQLNQDIVTDVACP